MGMRATLLAIVAGVTVLSSCGRGTVFYAEGVDFATRDADLTICEQQAFVEHPIRPVTRYTPRVFVPASQQCTPEGACTSMPGRWEGGTPYAFDVNAEARAVAARACMTSRGYARMGLPACAPDVAPENTDIMPTLTDQTCLMSRAPQRPLIVNPVADTASN